MVHYCDNANYIQNYTSLQNFQTAGDLEKKIETQVYAIDERTCKRVFQKYGKINK